MNKATIYLAGGCFWGMEHYLKQIYGVEQTTVGFANGHTEHPSYRDVCDKNTGHAETVKCVYDKDKLPLGYLLQLFFGAIDPTSLNQQGEDKGTQYRTGIYFTDPADKPIIDKEMARLQAQLEGKVMVEVQPLNQFFDAEEYHQDYLDKNEKGYCHLPIYLFKKAKEANAPFLSTETLAEGLRNHRSVRRFSARPVSHQVLKEVVEMARFAPSWKNSQTVRYYAVEDETLKQKLAADCVCGFDWNTRTISLCPLLMVVTGKQGICGFEPDGSFTTSKQDRWQNFDAGIATQTFCLSAYAKGLGSVILGIFDEQLVKEALHLPEDEVVMALVAVGYPDAEPKPAPQRLEVDALLSFK